MHSRGLSGISLCLLWTLSLQWSLPVRRTKRRTSPRTSSRLHQQARPFDASDPPPLTLLIPAYNEEFRIGETLHACDDFLSSSDLWKDRSRILVVDDGSVDDTVRVVEEFTSRSSAVPLECLRLTPNQGKGAALAAGMRACPNDGLILTTDADGSAELDGLHVLYPKLTELIDDWSQPALVSGYRTYADASALRLIFRWGFRTVVKTVCGDLGVKDSQCGFKLMTAPAAKLLYDDLNLPGWSHDVEVLYRARELKIPVVEEDIVWEDKPGSKLVASPGGVIAVCAKMFWEVVRLRWGYERGEWKLPSGSLTS